MSFVPYQCLHVPVQATASALRAWQVWIILGGFALALYAWGLLLFVVPTACVIALVVTRALVQRLSRDDDLDWPDDGPATPVDVTVMVEPCPAVTGVTCWRCRRERADAVATALDQRIYLCAGCRVDAVQEIYRAAVAAVERGRNV